jgi:general secretion pathway protein D
MHLTRYACIALAMLTLTTGARAEPESSAPVADGVPIARLIATVAKKTGKKFVVDPRVTGNAIIVGQDPTNLTYSDLLTVLLVYGYIAEEYGGYVNVLPAANARQIPLHEVTGKESRPEAEFVTKVIVVKSQSAAELVPVLRPMIPQMGHLVALPCTNRLILVDTFANVQRLERIIEELDVGEPFKLGKCEPRENH